MVSSKQRIAAFLVLAAFLALALESRLRLPPRPVLLARGAPALVPGRPFALEDPVFPGRPAFALEAADEKREGIAARPSEQRAWVRARPDAAFRYEKTPEERGGIDPCALPKAEVTHFSEWKSISSNARVAFPKRAAVRADGGFAALLIFHGHDVAWTVLAPLDVPIVLFGATLRDYRSEYGGPEALGQLIGAVEQAVSENVGRPARARNVALMAWSGGYEAIGVLLDQSDARDRVDAVALLDGLHCSRDPEIMPKALEPFVRFARKAAEGKAFFFASHSSIDTDSFASTTETMHFLAAELGERPLRVRRQDVLGLELIEQLDRGGFHLRGYAGGGKRDHCAQLGLYPEVARALARRWKLEV